MNFIYLASKSYSRQMLLNQAGINFKLVDQQADEDKVLRNGSLQEIVADIARFKIGHAILPNGKIDGEVAFVLSADTMGMDGAGKICGKPESKEAAVEMLRSYRSGSVTCTAFCIDKKIWHSGKWNLDKRVEGFANATYVFDVPENEIERYFNLSTKAGIDYMNVSGAVAIEEFGAQYLKTINGSYTAVVGLPIYEVKKALIDLGFVL